MLSLKVCSQGRTSLRSPVAQPCGRHRERLIRFATFSKPRITLHSPTFGGSLRPTVPTRPSLPSRVQRAYNQGYDRGSRDRSSFFFNRNITHACIGTAIIVYAAWNFSDRGLVYSALEKQRAFFQTLGVSVPRELSTRPIREFLNRYFLLHANDAHNYPSWLGSALSHHNFIHIFFNLMVWSNFAPFLYTLPKVHYLALIFGSALASSGAWIYDQQRRGVATGVALGSSGVVSGIMATVTMLAPMMRASIFGLVPAPLFAITGGYFLLDTYFVQSERQSMVGHSAHVGGAVFGILYYTFFLRRFGGILGPRRY